MSGAAQEFVPEGAAIRPTKLFIGGITRNTTTKQLRDHFSRFGRVLDCVAMRQADGRPRGFGYVTLDSSKAADLCLAAPQVIDGRVVDMKRAVPEGDMENAPTVRLHTPSQGQRSPASLLGTNGGLSPTAGAFHASWPMAGALAGSAAMPYMGAPLDLRAPPGMWPWTAAHSMGLAAPDCLELLSTGSSVTSPHGMLATTPTQASWPTSPAPTACGLSARAPEFVPSFSANAAEFVPLGAVSPVSSAVSPLQLPPLLPAEQEARPMLRAALGEITNRLLGVVPDKKSSSTMPRDIFAGMENLENSMETFQQRSLKKNLQINTDAIFEDSENVPPSHAVYHAEKSQKEVEDEEEEEDDNDAEDDEESDSGDESGPLPSLGSAEHKSGTCKRCNFYPKGRCQNGMDCTFCHLPHDKRKPSRQEKRERKAQWTGKCEGTDSFQEEAEQDMQIMAYSVLPGLPPMQTTKLPTPLALPGTVFPCFPAPPPGLSLHSLTPWQPDEEVSPVRARTPMSLLSTVPVSPSCAQPMTLLATQPAQLSISPKAVQEQISEVKSTPAAVVEKVTMGTQTDEDEACSAGQSISREEMLRFRSIACGSSSVRIVAAAS